VLEGIEILDTLNEDIGREKKTFDVIRTLTLRRYGPSGLG
jgi:hypothetical protein